MAHELSIRSKHSSYTVELLSTPLQTFSPSEFVITDRMFEPWVGPRASHYFSLEANESHKSLSVVEEICSSMARAGVNQGSRVIAIGGGVIQDVTTLATSIYKRGIEWLYVPTTLAAMLDSCVGGKSSINVGKVKNLVGNIYPPKRVLIDTSYVTTLDTERIIDGLSEGVKISFARGEAILDEFLENPSSVEPNPGEELRALISTTLTAKKWFVEIDENDKKERRLLNFGHTFGHALEGASAFSVSHGVAVALGMLASIEFSGTREVEKVKKLSNYCINLLTPISKLLEQNLVDFSWSEFLRLIGLDKKNREGKIHIIMPDEHGNLVEARFENTKETSIKLEKSMTTALESVI